MHRGTEVRLRRIITFGDLESYDWAICLGTKTNSFIVEEKSFRNED